MRLDVLIAILAAVAFLIWQYRRDRRRLESERAVLLNDVTELLDGAELTQEPMQYPKLRGRYRGHEATIDAVVDNLAVRKVPSLWLRVTIRCDVAFAGSCDILARAHNVEFYSPSIGFDHNLRLPGGWPDHLTVKSDDPDRMPPEAFLTPHVSAFADPKVKELLVTPRGVRLVYQAAQAARAEYMVLRQSLFGPVTVPRALLISLLDRAVALAEALQRGAADAALSPRKAVAEESSR